MQVSLQHLTKRFGAVTALDDLSLDVSPGEVVAVLGTNGAGKSTLLRLLGAILVPTSGQILMDGELFGRDRIDLRKRLAFLPEFAPVYPSWSPLQQISMTVRLYDAETAESPRRIVDLLWEFDLLEVATSPLARLSRGQMYKTAVVAMLTVDPELWILDEPFATGMDARAVAAIRRHAIDAAKRGRTILFSTQLVEVVEPLASRIAVITRGQLTAWESVGSLRGKEDSLDEKLTALLDADPENAP